MQTLGKLAGLAVVGEGTGNKLGTLQDVLFDPKTGDITAFLVHPGGLFHKAQLLPRAAVRTLGADALLVAPDQVLEEVRSDTPVPGSVNGKGLDGRPLLDDTGKVLGKASDILVYEAELRITAIEYSTGVLASVFHAKPTVPLARVIAIGADSIVVPASFVPEEAEASSDTNSDSA